LMSATPIRKRRTRNLSCFRPRSGFSLASLMVRPALAVKARRPDAVCVTSEEIQIRAA